MSLKSFILQSLFVLLFCTSFLSAAEPVDPFGIRKDPYYKVVAYVGSRYYVNTPITRHLLVSEAKAFWGVLQWKILPKLHHLAKPGMVSALYTGDGKIYFATSIKGRSEQTDMGFPPFIGNVLHGCKEKHGGQCHIFKERCAELMVLTEWYFLNGGWDRNPHLKLPEKGKLIVAVDHNLLVKKPCSKESNPESECHFGCADVLKKLGFNSALEIVETDPTIAGKPAPKKPTAQTSPQVKPKPPSNDRPKPAPQGRPNPPPNNMPKPAPQGTKPAPQGRRKTKRSLQRIY